MPTLTHFRFCPLSRSIRLALGECGVDAKLVEMRPWEWTLELLDLNPSGELPVLHWPSAEGEFVLRGAYAIAEYLAATESHSVPESTVLAVRRVSLMPDTPLAQAEVRRLIDWFHGKLNREVTQPLLDSHVLPMFKGTAHAAPEADVLRAARANLAYHLSYVAWLAEHRNWLGGEDLSLGDLAAGAHLSCLDYLGEIDWPRHPSVKAWYQRLKSRKSFQTLLADRVPGRPPAAHYAELDF